MNLDELFSINSVCLVGASREEGKIGNVVLKNLKKNFRGEILLVHPVAEEIEGIRCYKSIDSIPHPVDLGVISLPSVKAVEAVRALAERGCKVCIPVAGGFGEQGEEGRKLENQMKEISSRTGTRIIGPNCVGVIIPRIGLNTALTTGEKTGFPSDGPIAFVSQSGALGLLAMDEFSDSGVGFSSFVSLGNEIDVDETEMVRTLERDGETKSIAIYLEKISEIDEFLKACRSASEKKGIVVLKGGQTESGSRATSLHTGSLLKTSFSLKGIFRQNGIIQASNEIELIDFASALAFAKPVRGRRVAVVSSAGGVGVIATDVLETQGFKVNRTSDQLAGRIKSMISQIGSPFNPIDMTAEATNIQYENVINEIDESGEFDSILAFVLYQTFGVTEDIIEFLDRFNKSSNIPIVVGMIGGQYTRDIFRRTTQRGIPVFPTVQRAANALGALYERGEFLRRFER
ncbi:MAG: acetate--CoA ligase family protein [Thermoplasmata archaeon]